MAFEKGFFEKVYHFFGRGVGPKSVSGEGCLELGLAASSAQNTQRNCRADNRSSRASTRLRALDWRCRDYRVARGHYCLLFSAMF